MSLGEQQRTFAHLVGILLRHIVEAGYSCTFGEAYRPKETAELYARQGRGISNSLHCDRLAIDLNLFKDGVYLTGTDAYREIGEWWERYHPSAAWGGRFTKPDGNHFSLQWQGRK